MATVEYRHHLLQALKAREFFKADVDYVVVDFFYERKTLLDSELLMLLEQSREFNGSIVLSTNNQQAENAVESIDLSINKDPHSLINILKKSG